MDAVINLDKPKGITSQDAVTKVKKILKVKKAGHAGTLDPIATGVLLVCTGEATKITRFLMDFEKEYVATLRLGQRTDTLDAEGEIVEEVKDFTVTREEAEAVLGRFRGEIDQLPPMYSALKRDGTPLYKLARQGVEVEREPRKITISELELLSFEPPFMEIRTVCSKGTYIRTLADDIGMALGMGAHMTELRRKRIGPFSVDGAAYLETLKRDHEAVISIDKALAHLPEVVIPDEQYRYASMGNPVPAPLEFASHEGFLRMKDTTGILFAIGFVREHKLRIERKFRTD